MKANFPSVPSNKVWVASVVKLTSARAVLLPVRCEPNRSLPGGVRARGGGRGGGCAAVPYGEQRHNEQLHLLAWTQEGWQNKTLFNKVLLPFYGAWSVCAATFQGKLALEVLISDV